MQLHRVISSPNIWQQSVGAATNHQEQPALPPATVTPWVPDAESVTLLPFALSQNECSEISMANSRETLTEPHAAVALLRLRCSLPARCTPF